MSDQELDLLLQTWKAEAELPRDFQRQVWRRIEATPPPLALFGWLEAFLNWIAAPIPATAVCAAGLAFGIVAAGWTPGPAVNAPAAAYAHSINPLAQFSAP